LEPISVTNDKTWMKKVKHLKMIQVEAVLGSLSRKGGFMFSKGSSNNPTGGGGVNSATNGVIEEEAPKLRHHDPPFIMDSAEKTPQQPHHLHQNVNRSVTSTSGGSGRKSNATMSATVVFLDDSTHVFELDKKAKGQALLDAVFCHLDIHEREYFGLTFNDSGGSSSNHSPDVMRWLDPSKFIRKQLRRPSGGSAGGGGGNGASGSSILLSPFNDSSKANTSNNASQNSTFYFRVKFYVTDPSRLHEELTRYHVYLQVRKDIAEGRLSAPFSTLCLLTSYVVQAVLGDFDFDTCRPGYLTQFKDLRKLCLSASSTNTAGNVNGCLSAEDIERRISELHKLHKGQPPSEAEINFLEHAKRLEMYGISLHNGKDSHGRDIQLGVTCIGLVVFQNNVRINTFSWSKIVKISFKREQFFIQLRKESSESYDTLLGFNLASYRSCKNLWKSAVEHHSFFRLHSPKVAPRRFLMTLGSKFRYSGRTEFQTHSVTGPGQPGPPGPKGGGGGCGATDATSQKFPRSTMSRKTLPLNLSAAAAASSGGGRVPKLASPETSSIGSSVHSCVGGGGGLKPKPTGPPPPLQVAPPTAALAAVNISSAPSGQSRYHAHKPEQPKRGCTQVQPELNGSTWSGTSGSTTTGGQSLAHRAIESFNNKVQSLSTKLPKKAWQEDVVSDDEGGFLDPNRRISSLGRLTKTSSASPTPNATTNSAVQKGQLSVTPTASLSLSKPSVRLAYADESSLSDKASVEATSSFASGFSSGSSIRKTPGPGALSIPIPTAAAAAPTTALPPSAPHPSQQSQLATASFSSAMPTLVLTSQPPEEGGNKQQQMATAGSSAGPNPLDQVPSSSVPATVTRCRPPKLDIPPAISATAVHSEQSQEESNGGLVFITIIPDEQGRFGFDVKGGVDQKLPIIVSRVGANTPADKCYPKLNEGDQVVLINGRDVSTHTHDQVVNFIRASSEPHSGQLILAVKQNVYLSEDVEAEPDFEYVPESPSPSILKLEGAGGKAGQAALLSQSMLLLEESLSSNAIVGQFEQLYRRNPSLLMSVCHSAENMAKNRYRDISPYDSTRVVLSECPSGDYINANHVVMTIQGSGIVNRYIATQGPLASTCTDFWYMVWECQSSLIIMLTTIVERGRTKCHQYWPDVGQSLDFGQFKVTCVKEESGSQTKSFVFRDFTIQDTRGEGDTGEIRHITQMAYLSWPDHGVPDNDDEFVDFVERVRARRQGNSLAPTVVHCSAGIGRTGVLILMESALYLIEANQPVYPLDLTRIMRDQRASMIQTGAQYRFVCQAILRVFQTAAVKPLPEFSSPKLGKQSDIAAAGGSTSPRPASETSTSSAANCKASHAAISALPVPVAAKNKLDIGSSEVQVQAAEKADFKEVHPSGLPLTLPTAPTLSEESNPEPAASEQKAAATDSA